jgi:hypothetical protein
MKRVFFTRYSYGANGDLVQTRLNDHVPFSTVTFESYPSRIWFSLMMLQDKMKKLMCYKRQQQVCALSTIFSFPLEAWRFICGALYPTMRPIVYPKSRTVINRFCDLSLSSTSSLVSFAMLRFQTATELQRAREIFGSSFGIGSRNHAPRKGYVAEFCRLVML